MQALAVLPRIVVMLLHGSRPGCRLGELPGKVLQLSQQDGSTTRAGHAEGHQLLPYIRHLQPLWRH